MLDTVAADKTHRGHAIIEQVHADLKNSALAHPPTVREVHGQQRLAGTIRRTSISVSARVASSARRLTLHLPKDWPWQTQWTELFTRTCGPPATASS